MIPNSNLLYNAVQSLPTPRPSAAPPSGKNLNKVPPRLRAAGAVLDRLHMDATTSYRTKKNGSHHHHHHQQKQKKYNVAKECKAHANNKVQNVTAASRATRNEVKSDSEVAQDSQADTRRNAEGSNTGNFGARKVSRS